MARVEYDVLDNVVRAMTAAPDDAYWARRLVDLVRDPITALRLRPHLVEAIRRWAEHDPSFFVHERYLAEQLAVWAWPREILEDLDVKLVFDDRSLSHLIVGRLWLEARRSPDEIPHFFARAALHLREVEPRLQVGAWHEAMCEALGVADPDELARRAARLVASAAPSARDRAVLAILRGAARAGNWNLYDEHRRTYGELDDSGLRMNSEVARLDMQRAEHDLRSAPPPPLRRPRSAPSSEPNAMTVRPPSRPR